MLKIGGMANLKTLPNEITKQWRHFQENPSSWQKFDNFATRELKEGSEEWDRVMALFEKLEGGSLRVNRAYAIYNEPILKAFTTRKDVLLARKENSKGVFFNTNWKKNDSNGEREWVSEKYNKVVGSYEWNHEQSIPILPALHGTSSGIALKIAETGFAALSKVDVGWYGKGIYFTSHALYTIPYLLTTPEPAVIISYIIPGNIYPVRESADSENTLRGSAIKPGYDSHYVITNKEGNIASTKCKELFDEFVIDQEGQIAPAFILYLGNDTVNKYASEYNRFIENLSDQLNSARDPLSARGLQSARMEPPLSSRTKPKTQEPTVMKNDVNIIMESEESASSETESVDSN